MINLKWLKALALCACLCVTLSCDKTPQNEKEGDKSVDLSLQGTANSYIVSEAGAYKFRAMQGNSSSSVGDVSSVEVLWESNGTATAPAVGSLVKNVSYKDSYIVFEASSAKGNALIAAKDGSGKVLWSWHIWMTDQPKDQVYYNNVGIMMDRNLGATSATPGDVKANGLLYQWGRKDPFMGAASIDSDIQAVSTLSPWPAPVGSDATTGTVLYAQEHPTTFLSDDGKYPHDWMNKPYNSLWSTTKTKYDPCPPGYRVPIISGNGIWAAAVGGDYFLPDSAMDNSKKGANLGGMFGSDATIWYPMTGSLSYKGKLCNVGKQAYYWATTSEILQISVINDLVTFTVDWAICANSVRCCKQ